MVERGRAAAARPLSGRTRRREGRRRERTVLYLGIAAVLLVLIIPAYGYVANFVLPPRQVVVRVNDTTYTLGDIVRYLRVFQREAESSGGTMNLGVLPFQVVNNLAENELIRQGVSREGLVVSEEELVAELRLRVLGPMDPDSEATEDELTLEFQERYRRYLNIVQLTEAEHRDTVLLDVYREKLRDALEDEVPTVAPQVHLYKITLATEEDADEVRTEFARGALFSDLVERYDGGAEAIRKEGEVGWQPRGITPELDALTFDTLAIGELSDVQPEIASATNELTLAMYLVTEIDEAREVSASHRETLKQRAMQEWIAREWGTNVVENNFNSEQYEWIIKQIRLSASRP